MSRKKQILEANKDIDAITAAGIKECGDNDKQKGLLVMSAEVEILKNISLTLAIIADQLIDINDDKIG